MSISLESIYANGVVGAGGAGFPTHVKMKARAEYFLLNAAECEPLLHKDKELLHAFPDLILRGMQEAQALTGADKAVIGVKYKYKEIIEDLERRLPPGMSVFPLTDTYPAGDEMLMVYDITRRVIPPGGLPIHVGCVVNNVETMLNIGREAPVTKKYLTVAGAVREPVTLCVPVGMAIEDVIRAAGGAAIEDYAVLLNGAMMGKICKDLTEPVTKTTGGIYILPRDHVLIRRHGDTFENINRIGRSACDQCSFCTEMCPRYLLGHPIEPHKAMRALGFTMEKASLIVGTSYCCECNLCSMIACPEDLDPKNVCVQDKSLVKQMGLKWEGDPAETKPHSMYDHRRTPISRLITKLGLQNFKNKGPLREGAVETGRVRLPLKQHVGAPCAPLVRVGQKVKEGEAIAAPEAGQLGAPIHASLSGTVTAVNGMIEIQN